MQKSEYRRWFNGLVVCVPAVISIICVLSGSRYCFGGQVEHGTATTRGSNLRIYLPREVVVKSDSIQLGDVVVMQGDEVVVARAGEIGLGKFALAGQQIVIDRRTIFSRLASSGIKAEQVSLSGAEQVKVKRDEKVIGGRRFVDVALAFLRSEAAYKSVDEVALVGNPKDRVLTNDGNQVKLKARLGAYSGKDKARIWVGVVVDGVETGGCEVVFELKYNRRQMVAVADLGVGAVLSPENVKIEKTMASAPEPGGWSVPYGQVVKRRLKKGAVITGNVVGPAEPPVVIKRGQTVVMEIETGGLYVSALGTALSDGKVGQFIRIKGPNDSRIVVGKVKSDGTVEPIF
jgi:flagella basal body P-ring formation protein FlgA